LAPNRRRRIGLQKALDQQPEADRRDQRQRGDRRDLVAAAHAGVEHQQRQRDRVGHADEVDAGERVRGDDARPGAFLARARREAQISCP
jgi:hypothetical protein